MTERYYTRVFHSKFIARCADLEGDEIGLYSIAFMLMCERRAPLPDDMAWLGRKAGISTRRANQIRTKLLDHGKWRIRAGMIGDPVALEEFEYQSRRSEVARSNAMARWHGDDQPLLDLENGGKQKRKRQKSANSDNANASEPPKAAGEMRSGEKEAEKPGKNARTNAFISENAEQETAEIRQSGPEFACKDSRARASTQSQESNNHTTDHDSELGARSLDRDPAMVLIKVKEASGFSPTSPEAEAAALERVSQWLEDGIDPKRTILPTIRRMIEKADPLDPTSSLNRFERQIRAAHAKAGSAPARAPPSPSAPAPPAPPSEDPRFIEIQATLRRDCGARTFDGWLRPIIFSEGEGAAMLCALPSSFMADWVQQHFADRLAREGAKHGFKSVRIFVASPPGRRRNPEGQKSP